VTLMGRLSCRISISVRARARARFDNSFEKRVNRADLCSFPAVSSSHRTDKSILDGNVVRKSMLKGLKANQDFTRPLSLSLSLSLFSFSYFSPRIHGTKGLGGERRGRDKERHALGTLCIKSEGRKEACIKNDNLSYVSYVRPDKI